MDGGGAAAPLADHGGPRSDDAAELNAPRVALRLSDFDQHGVLGDGAYSQVVRVTRKSTGEQYALKIMSKRFIVKERKTEYVKNERNILDRLQYAGIVQLCFTFQDEHFLYMGMELAQGGELFSHIQRVKRFSEEAASFYIAETAQILAFLHSQGVIHRDLKPENLLLTEDGHLKLCDFGSAKDLRLPPKPTPEVPSTPPSDPEEAMRMRRRASSRVNSFVGTADYVSPEVLEGKGPATTKADYWALGAVLFQLLVGTPPFRGETEYLTFQRVIHRDLMYPKDYPEVLRDLTDKLLCTDVEERLGEEGVRAHATFDELEWDRLREMQPPPFAEGCAPFRSQDAPEIVKDTVGGDEAPASAGTEAAGEGGDSAIAAGDWGAFCSEGESVVRATEIKKKRGFFTKRRMLVLTDKPRLFYVDTSKHVVMGEVEWHANIRVTVADASHFTVHTSERDYAFEALANDAHAWGEDVARMHANFAQ